MRSFQIILLVIFFAFISNVTCAQTVEGNWKTYDIFNKDREESIVKISVKNNVLSVKIVQIIPKEHRLDSCVKCTDHRKNMPITGMIILDGATLENGIWKGAQILNAKNGKEYGCHISLSSADVLKIIGFVGYPIFGKTLYWTRVKTNDFR